MTNTTVLLRGESVDAEYKDHGYEPDTNAHVIDWYLADSKLHESLTSDEMDSIEDQIREAAWQRQAYGDD